MMPMFLLKSYKCRSSVCDHVTDSDCHRDALVLNGCLPFLINCDPLLPGVSVAFFFLKFHTVFFPAQFTVGFCCHFRLICRFRISGLNRHSAVSHSGRVHENLSGQELKIDYNKFIML